MTAIHKNRLAKELDMLTRDPPPGISVVRLGEASENERDTRLWVACVLVLRHQPASPPARH